MQKEFTKFYDCQTIEDEFRCQLNQLVLRFGWIYPSDLAYILQEVQENLLDAVWTGKR